MQENTADNREKLLKFLYLSEDKFPPFRVDVKVLFGEEMVGRGHQIDWLLQSEQACEKAMVSNWSNSRVYVGATDLGTSRYSRIKKHIKDLLNDFKMFKLASNEQYDVIQVKDKFISAILAIFAARKNKCKFTYWLSYPFPEASLYEARMGVARYPVLYYLRGTLFKFLLYRIITKYADHVFVQSEQMKRDVMKEGVEEKKLTAVPMGISVEMFNKLGVFNNIDTPKKNKKIVYLGTLLKTRKLDFVIYVFEKVLGKEPDATLYMVGPEEQEGDLELLEQLAKKLNIDNKITFTGRLPQEEALMFVSEADVCVSPFYPTPILNSTSPTKLIEYMAMKKPVVANDHPEQSLVISESGAGICVPYNVDAFAEAIVKILADPGMAREMGERGCEYVSRNRTYDNLAVKVETVYKKLCHS